jgi:hypothetical protein
MSVCLAKYMEHVIRFILDERLRHETLRAFIKRPCQYFPKLLTFDQLLQQTEPCLYVPKLYDQSHDSN